MKFSEYIKDKILICLLHLLCMILLMGFFYITGYNRNAAALILIFWWIILGIWIVTGYYRRKKYFDRAEHILENVDQRYLLGELLPASPYLEDRIYRELIRRSNKSVIERIRMLEDEQNDYRDYIESWVHEIKAPITSIQLACENHKDEVTRQIGLENQRIENDVDMVLYYARMEKVYKHLVTTLEGIEVKPIEAVGQPFDPNFHNAVMHVEDENFGENIVAEEFQKGYTYRDSVVRHSMVKVAN